MANPITRTFYSLLRQLVTFKRVSSLLSLAHHGAALPGPLHLKVGGKSLSASLPCGHRFCNHTGLPVVTILSRSQVIVITAQTSGFPQSGCD